MFIDESWVVGRGGWRDRGAVEGYDLKISFPLRAGLNPLFNYPGSLSEAIVQWGPLVIVLVLC